MSFFKRLLAISIIGFSNTACADVVYLECQIVSNKTTNYKITLDENAQTVVFTNDGLALNDSYKLQAQFAQTDVKFKWVIPGLNFVMQYRIDRVSLAFEETFNHRNGKTVSGVCKIAEPVERKF
ncbi:MAG: hypothetical protein ACREPB_00315 [Arenimonas sp.]